MLCILYKNCTLFQKLAFIQWNKNHLHAHTNTHANKLVDNNSSLLEKQIQQLLYTQEYLMLYPKVSHHLI